MGKYMDLALLGAVGLGAYYLLKPKEEPQPSVLDKTVKGFEDAISNLLNPLVSGGGGGGGARGDTTIPTVPTSPPTVPTSPFPTQEAIAINNEFLNKWFTTPTQTPTTSLPVSDATTMTLAERLAVNATTPAAPVYTPSTYSSPVIQQAQTASAMYEGGASIAQITATLQASDPSVVSWRPGR